METSSNTTNHRFFKGGGELGELTRTHDWSKTALGPVDQWPQSLHTLVTMMLTSRFPMLIFWGPELITFYNDAFRPSLGDNGKHPSSLGQKGEQSWAESWPVIGPMIYDIMAGGEAVWFEDQKLPLYRDGQLGYAYWTYSFSPLTGDDGEVNGILVTCSETTQAVEARNQAEETQQQVLAFFEQSPVGIAIISADKLTYRMANPFYGYLVGRAPDQLVGKSLLEALPELAGQGFDGLLEEVIRTGIPFIAKEVAVDLVRNDQLETIYVDLAYQPRREADQRISGILVVATDVTQQVLSRQTIEESEARFRTLIEEAPVATCLFMGRELRIELANQMMLDVWGKDQSVLGKPLVKAVPELKGQPFLAILDEVFTKGQVYRSRDARAELEVDGVLGTYYFDFTCKPLFNAAGEVYAIMDMAVDVTQPVINRQRLEAQEAALRNAVDLAELGTWTLDIASGDTYLSPRHADMFGLSTTVMSYETALAIVHPDDRERVRAAFEAALQPGSDGRYGAEYRIINATSGQQQLIRAKGETQRDAQGQPLRIAGTTQDVTLERESQLVLKQLVQQRTQELAATNEVLVTTNENFVDANQALERANSDLLRSNQNLEQFAYIASHDLQEPLRKIQQFGDLLKLRFADSLDSQELVYLDRMQLAARRMSVLIKDLLAFSRISTTQAVAQPVKLHEVVNQVLESLSVAIEESGAQIEVDELPTVQGDPLQLSQLFQNLLANALKFRRTDSTGTLVIPQITVRAQRLSRGELPASAQSARDADQYHLIEVIDNGIGFEEKYLDRIFQVFQRLHGKNEFAGTGVGLAIAQKVITNHGGAIMAISKLNEGATFCVYLPAS